MKRTTLYVIHYDAATGDPVFGALVDALDDAELFGRWTRPALHQPDTLAVL